MLFVVVLRQPEFFAKKFLPAIGPLSLLALLFTIIVIFAGQGDAVVRSIVNVLRVAAPLLVYFIVRIRFSPSLTSAGHLLRGALRLPAPRLRLSHHRCVVPLARAVCVETRRSTALSPRRGRC